MKKLLVLILFISVCIFLNKSDEIRVRVIANSNSEEDLIIKKEIISHVENFLNKIDKDEKDYINDNIEDLRVELNNITDCSVSFEEHLFMNKAYNNISLKNEKYLTLLVVIGDGKGDNWWTTLYPINNQDPTTVKYKSWILERVDKND